MALLILATQQGAWRHQLGHWAGALTSSTQAAPGKPGLDTLEAPCLQCLAFAATADSVATATGPAPHLAAAHVHVAAPAHTPHQARTALAYRSRAPPLA